jgi:hypothetical protein
LSLPQDINTDANVVFDSVRVDSASETINIDTFQQQAFWSTSIGTSAALGTKPQDYVYYVNLGGVSNGRGLQLATSYGSNDSQYFVRRRSDNGSAPNGANVWQPWRRVPTEETTGHLVVSAQATATNHTVLGGRTITINGTTNQVNVSATSQNLTADRT